MKVSILQLDKKEKKLKKGFSLLEIIISLAIMGFAITVMFSFLILSMRVSVISLSRSFIREELSNITTLISRDIRNSDFVLNCGTQSFPASCEFIQEGTRYIWQRCDSTGTTNANASLNTRACKVRLEGTTRTVLYLSPQSLVVDTFSFSLGYVGAANDVKTNIIFLITASHSNSSYNISNVLRQISVSTRNF